MTTKAEAAVAYARVGIPVFPLHYPIEGGASCSCYLGAKCDAIGKHPAIKDGVLGASTDPDEIAAVWSAYPDYNIGLATGHVFDVLDIDSLEGLETLELELDRSDYAAEPLLPEGAPYSRTSKGWHILYQPTGEGNRAAMVPGVDWRGLGGYIAAPPSMHESGHVYEWALGIEISRAAIPTAPWRLLEMVCRLGPWEVERRDSPEAMTIFERLDKTQGGSLDGVYEVMESAVEGERNHTLFWCANRVLDDWMEGRFEEIEPAMNELWTRARSAGLGDHEIERTIRSAERARTT